MEIGKAGRSGFSRYTVTLVAPVIIMLFVSVFWVRGQTSYNDKIYEAFICGKMDIWKYNMDRMEEKFLRDRNIHGIYDLTYAYYGYIVYCIVTGDESNARRYIDKARHNTDILLKHDSLWAEIYSLRGALFGFEIGLDPLKALEYGVKSIRSINRAVELDSDNARILMELGNMKYYTPWVLGGGLKKAINYHEKAVNMFEANRRELKNDWIYLLVLTNLARWYSEDNRINEAGITYRKILDIEPDYLWVRDYLYPELVNKR
jgi:tetratricopeptide (TPR) repeat protein